LPAPAPATLELLKGIPIYSKGIDAELATPTGVAILKNVSTSFGDMPAMKVEKTGYGAGSRDLQIPNLLRICIGEADKDAVEKGSTTREGLTRYATFKVDQTLKDGDTIEIESPYGRKVQGTLKLTEAQHPQTVAIAACSGHWAKGQPVARGKGANFDDLLELDLKHVDPVSLNIETAVRVKVRKIAR
jgi:hypothetical protein